MLGIGGSLFYKVAVKSDGTPNWPGIVILAAVGLVTFVWRCVVIGSQSEVLVRQRFGRVATRRRSRKHLVDGFEQFSGAIEYDGGVHLRFYMVHSLLRVNVADRKTELEGKTITYYDRDYEISPAIIWGVSRDNGCPAKALFNVQDGDPKDKKNAELEAVVLNLVDDAVVRAYALLEQGVETVPTLPVLTVDEDLVDVKQELYEHYGVELRRLLYGQHAVAPAQREKEGNLAIAAAQEKVAEAQNNMADAIRSHGSVVSDQ